MYGDKVEKYSVNISFPDSPDNPDCPDCPRNRTIKMLHGDIHPFEFQGAKHQIHSVASLIELIKRKGSIENTRIFYNYSAIEVILDATVITRPWDRAIYPYMVSQQYTEWKSIFGEPLSQKEFFNFLRRHPEGEIADIETLMAVAQKLKVATKIVGEYSQTDSNNVTFVFKASDGEGQATIPRYIYASLPLLNESDYIVKLEIELELHKPKSEEEKPVFVLSCPKLARYIEEAIKHEVNVLKEALPGYLILAGRIE